MYGDNDLLGFFFAQLLSLFLALLFVAEVEELLQNSHGCHLKLSTSPPEKLTFPPLLLGAKRPRLGAALLVSL